MTSQHLNEGSSSEGHQLAVRVSVSQRVLKRLRGSTLTSLVCVAAIVLAICVLSSWTLVAVKGTFNGIQQFG